MTRVLLVVVNCCYRQYTHTQCVLYRCMRIHHLFEQVDYINRPFCYHFSKWKIKRGEREGQGKRRTTTYWLGIKEKAINYASLDEFECNNTAVIAITATERRKKVEFIVQVLCYFICPTLFAISEWREEEKKKTPPLARPHLNTRTHTHISKFVILLCIFFLLLSFFTVVSHSAHSIRDEMS